MANDSLKKPVEIQAQRIDATFLPPGFSTPYQLYVIQQSIDSGAVANKANEAGAGAYDAQVDNEEQDVTLADHEQRITDAEQTLADHETRISAAEAKLDDHEQRITEAETEITAQGERITTLEDDVSAIQTDYVSKSATALQNLASPISVATSYSVNGVKVLGERQTGWTAATGTANKGTFNADQTFTVSATYSQAEVQDLATALIADRQRTKALEDAMRAHGLID